MPRRRTGACLAALAFAATHGAAADRAGYTLAEIDRFGRQLAADRCQRPVEVKTSFVPTPGDTTSADEMLSIDCRAFKVAVYRARGMSPARESPMSVLLVGAVPGSGAWAVGASASDVRATLGAPARLFGENLVYVLPGIEQRDTLVFEVRAGVVQALSWNWDVD